jgi:hypothetical protein
MPEIIEIALFFPDLPGIRDLLGETLKFDTRLKYGLAVIIIAFGPDDWILKRNDEGLFD